MIPNRCLRAALIMLSACAAAWSGTKEERGKYLVNGVTVCGSCDAPPVADDTLQSIELVQGRQRTDPDLSSRSRLFLKWKEEVLIQFLESGLNPASHPVNAPTLTCKVKCEDAEAVVSHLKTPR